MSRIMAIDFGLRRTGIAITDPLRMIASPLTTVATGEFFDFFDRYITSEEVEKVIVGWPLRSDSTLYPLSRPLNKFVRELKTRHPGLEVVLLDERYTSRLAAKAMVEAGFKKKQRQKKENLDKISAAILLQEYLETQVR